MAIFGLKPWLTRLEKFQFFDSKTSCFYSLERRVFVLQCRKRHFPSLYCLKKKRWKNFHLWIKTMEKWLFLDKNHGLTTLEKWPFSTFWTSCFYSLERRFFVLEYRERHFPGLYCLNQKKTLKNGHFWTKTMG